MRNLLHKYFDRTKVGRFDYFRQLLFLTFVPLSIFLFGLHLVGSYGLTIKPALACSACYILVASVALIAYLFQGPKKLKRIMPVCLVLLMVIQSVRLLVLASIGLHAPMLTTVNITVCYMIVLLCSISLLSRTSFVCTCINFTTIFLCRDLTHNPMYGQLLIIYGFMSVATTVFGFVAGTLLREQQMELDDYAHTIDQVLHVFNMSKTELLALLKLAKAKDADAVYDTELME